MKLIKIVSQYRFDFDGVAECEFCGKHQTLENGYDDNKFYAKVIPAIKCAACNKRTNEIIPEDVSDPGYQGGRPLELRDVTIKQWLLV